MLPATLTAGLHAISAKGVRGTGRGTGEQEIPAFWVQRQHFNVASVQVADAMLGSMLLLIRCSGLGAQCLPKTRARAEGDPASQVGGGGLGNR